MTPAGVTVVRRVRDDGVVVDIEFVENIEDPLQIVVELSVQRGVVIELAQPRPLVVAVNVPDEVLGVALPGDASIGAVVGSSVSSIGCVW